MSAAAAAAVFLLLPPNNNATIHPNNSISRQGNASDSSSNGQAKEGLYFNGYLLK